MRRYLVPLIRLFLIVISFVQPAFAAHPPVCVVLLSGTSLGQWTGPFAPPTLHAILQEGSVAVMNVRTARDPKEELGASPGSAALTLSSGARCMAPPDLALHQPSDTAPFGTATCGQILLRRTGALAPPSSLVYIDWPMLLYTNSDLGYRALPGCLITALRDNGITTYAGGGPEAFIAGLEDGYVLRGSPIASGTSLRPDTLWIVDLGGRQSSVEPELARIRSRMAAVHGLLIVASLDTNAKAYQQGRRLTPVVFDGPGFPAGVLSSPSTHTAGLIILPDITSSIARWFGLTSIGPVYGSALSSKPGEGADTASTIERVANDQRAAMRLLPAMAVLIGIATLGVAFLGRNKSRSIEYGFVVPVILFWLVVSPNVPIALVASLLSYYPLVLFARASGSATALGLLCALPLIAILTDPLHGSPFMLSGMAGYSVIEGARYYGIGNEAMGIVFGASLVLALLLGRDAIGGRFLALATGLLCIVALLGLPQAGAKVGGVLVGVGTFGVFLVTLKGGRLRPARILLILAVAVLILILFLVVDRHVGAGQESHLGRLLGNGLTPGDLVDIAHRKIEVELRLLYHSCWAVALAGGLAAFIATARDNAQRRAYRAASIAAIVLTLVLNDAGVVACALMLPYLVAGNLYETGNTAAREKDTARTPISDAGPLGDARKT